MMYWPQIVLLVLIGSNLGIGVVKHGEPEKGRHNVLVTLLSNALLVTLLYFGGFWS